MKNGSPLRRRNGDSHSGQILWALVVLAAVAAAALQQARSAASTTSPTPDRTLAGAISTQ